MTAAGCLALTCCSCIVPSSRLFVGRASLPRFPLPRVPANSILASQALRHAVEMAVLSSVRHPNIVQAYACMPDVALETGEKQWALCAHCQLRWGLIAVALVH
jgi:hypothetical protein